MWRIMAHVFLFGLTIFTAEAVLMAIFDTDDSADAAEANSSVFSKH